MGISTIDEGDLSENKHPYIHTPEQKVRILELQLELALIREKNKILDRRAHERKLREMGFTPEPYDSEAAEMASYKALRVNDLGD
jgi:hypothetical protein